jgi:hypothetical protein
VVFDEAASTDTTHGGGHVATVVVGPQVKKGYKSTALYQHQNLLRTMLDSLGVSTYPAAAATAKPMSDMFGASTGTNTTCTAAITGVTVCSPSSGATVGSPVHVTAAAKSSSASITAMRIYVDSVSQYLTHTSTIDTSLPLASGSHSMVLQAWDSTGAVYKTSVSVKVQ